MAARFTQNAWLNKVYLWLVLHPRWLLVIAVLAVLVPFLAKPFNMDDPLFIWAARQIHAHPGNPYGFAVNWYGTVTPMWEVTKNPPLACYYLATAAQFFGWSELALHAAFLLPALAVILGTYRLASRFCGRPLWAALLTLLTPVFLVSSTTVMCDVLMLALWIWAVVFWVEGIRGDNWLHLTGAGLLIALATLTKYYAVALVPLLAAYGLVQRKSLGVWLLGLLIPVVVLGAYHLTTQHFYGRTLLGDALNYTAMPKGVAEFASLKSGSSLTALAFTGGCLAVVTFLTPLLWRIKQLSMIAGGVGLLAFLCFESGTILKDYGPITGSSRWFIEFQIIFWAIGGGGVLALAFTDVWRRRDADSWLLGLWVIGTFLFAALFNWTVNGRTILPMTPAVALLLVRRLELNAMRGKSWPEGAGFGAVAGAMMALWVAWADFGFARAVRESARLTFAKYGNGSARFWYQGHWGFQYYLDQLGAKALDAERTRLQRADLIATPENNTNFAPLGPELVVLREIIAVPGTGWLATMKGEVGAGFYASSRGPLPFAFGLPPAERVFVCVVDPISPPAPPTSSIK